MDVLYPLKQHDNNNELRCSLRSLKNIPHDRVFVCGWKPFWMTDDVVHIPTDQDNNENKYLKSTRNLIKACEDERLSDDFILMNDDMYIMRPITEIPVMHRGPINDVINWYWKRHSSGPYANGMVATFHRLDRMGCKNIMSYELHVPMVVNKKKFLETLKLSLEMEGFGKRTLYGNINQIGGVQAEDVKYSTRRRDIDPELAFISTEEASFMYHPIGNYIREKFNKRCKYERKPQ